MTPRLRSLAACLALLAFVAGGLVGPVLHRAEHGLEHEHTRQHIAAQTDHVHVEGASVFTVSLKGVGGEHAHCALCLPVKHRPLAVASVPGRSATDRRYAPQRPGAPATVILAQLPIRGPPRA